MDKIIKEFRILLAKYGSPIEDNPYGYNKAREKEGAIETFILKALKEQREVWEKLVKDLVHKKDKDCKQYLKEQKEDILKIGEELKESGEENDKAPYDQPQPRAYNKALKDYTNLIKSDICF